MGTVHRLVVQGRVADIRTEHVDTDVPDLWCDDVALQIDVHVVWRDGVRLVEWRDLLGASHRFARFVADPSLVDGDICVGRDVLVDVLKDGDAWRVRAIETETSRPASAVHRLPTMTPRPVSRVVQRTPTVP